MTFIQKILHRPFFIKLLHWEYWSFHAVYTPIYLYWLWLCIKARSFFFFNTSNPTIKNGGFLMESKKDIYDIIPQEYYPKTIFINANTNKAKILSLVNEAALKFPLIGKPDIGMRGLSVKKLETIDDIIDYAQNSKVDFLLQEFIPFEQEVGIFYYRYPNETHGHISGIVGKEFLTVTGDGISNMETLLSKDKRFILQLPALQKAYGDTLQKVLKRNEDFLLVPYGNHARGAKFIDLSHLADEQLTSMIDEVCKNVDGFYFGRMDVRYNTWEELKQGKNFGIVELNGAGSEPTHIYDPKHSIFFAWKEIIRHWRILWKISRINHHKQNMPYMNFSSGIRMFKENSAYVKMISTE
ncbi:D-alanine--D-alanine ligase [Panacibacter ginsenosidivorans]|uniref:D-alanine--D-alanine ligase n=1 Tax=Panacibacter ginsenosidivorans TaxID=1813871 RepID=A0A5B8V3N8_9BACT|nr:D-alanine--D-alanine ligase [Panacibacter ginsenosidivorans]QEC66040.1 D-alanine--D-alanine ligase [Panacibacter ginsenosidivorans]